MAIKLILLGVPPHVSLEGNETADEVTKAAALRSAHVCTLRFRDLFPHPVCHSRCLAGYMANGEGHHKGGENHGQGCTPVAMYHCVASPP